MSATDLINTVASTVLEHAAVAITTDTALSIPPPLSAPAPSTLQHQSLVTLDPTLEHLCDWTRQASDCRDSDFVRWMLIASSAVHAFMALYGVLLLVFRNRGWNRKVVTELFSTVGTGIRPKPMDCIIFFVSIACFIKVPVNLVLFFDVLKDTWWLRVALEQMYWVLASFAFSTYFVGLLYAMPVTTREGIFAVYRPEVTYGTKPLRPIHVLTPTSVQKNYMLMIGALYPLIGAAFGIASGAMHDRGHEDLAHKLVLAQYSNWSLIHFSLAVMFFYYGLKYTFILRANIIIAEQALKAPRAAFGIGNLISRSPARFLFIQLQITGFGGCAVMIIAGTLCLIWVLFRDKILIMQQPNLPRAMGFFWTCAIAVAYFVIMFLITVQSIKNRKRELRNQTNNTTVEGPRPSSAGHGGVDNSGARPSSVDKGSGHLTSSGAVSSYVVPSSFKSGGRYMSDLSQNNSNDVSTLHSVFSDKPSMERTRDNFYDGIGSEALTMHAAELATGGSGTTRGAGGYESDRDSLKAPASLTPPPRPAPLNLSGDGYTRSNYSPNSPPLSPTTDSYSVGNSQFNLIPTSPSPSQIRESVFGGRTPREESFRERGAGASSPPQSPTSPTMGGFHLPSFPRTSLKSGKRNSVTPRPSTSSIHSVTTISLTSRVSRPPSTRQQQQHQSPMSSSSLSTTLTSSSTTSIPATAAGPAHRQAPPTPSSPSSPVTTSSSSSSSSAPILYTARAPPQPLRQLSQPVPSSCSDSNNGGGSRKRSDAGLASTTNSSISLSAPIPSSSVSPSRGAGGGYKNQGYEMTGM